MSKDLVLELSLLGILRIEFKLEVITGLLIQAPQYVLASRIGGADRFPMTTFKNYEIHTDTGIRVEELEVPFIPGSTLKGRMRSLLEVALNKKLYSTDLKVFYHARFLEGKYPEALMTLDEYIDDITKRCEVDDLFGSPSIHFSKLKDWLKEKKAGGSEDVAQIEAKKLFSILAPTRLLVDDLYPSEDYVSNLYRIKGRITIDDFIEDKPENRIDRITSAADPREMVRVRPGVEFSGVIRLLIYDRDLDDEGADGAVLRKYLNALVLSMKLVEETYLGSCGSRGYGRVKFKNLRLKLLKIDHRELKLKEIPLPDETQPKEYTTLQDLTKDLDNVVQKIVKELKEVAEAKANEVKS